MRTTTKHTLCAWAWVALLPLMAACGNDDDAAREGATVTLAFTTRANAPAAPLAEGEEGPANANESMRHLRIIMQRTDDGRNEIQFNYERTFTAEEQATTTTVTFEGVPAGTYNFYAVANETADYSNIQPGGLEAMLQQELGASVLSAINGGTQAIPAACVLPDVTVPDGADQHLAMTLLRAVAKLRVRIINESGDPQTVNNMVWNNAGAATTALFPPEAVTASMVSGSTAIGTSGEIPATGTNTWEDVHYVYEGLCGADGLTFTAEWPAGTPRTISLKDAGEVLARNTLLDLAVTLEAAPFNMTWTYRVVPWEEATNEITFD